MIHVNTLNELALCTVFGAICAFEMYLNYPLVFADIRCEYSRDLSCHRNCVICIPDRQTCRCLSQFVAFSVMAVRRVQCSVYGWDGRIWVIYRKSDRKLAGRANRAGVAIASSASYLTHTLT